MEQSPPSSSDAVQAVEIDLARRPDHFLMGFEEDVSKLALFVPSDQPPPLRTAYAVRLALPSGGVVDAVGVVTLHRDANPGQSAGYVMCFRDLDAQEIAMLETFVRVSTAPRISMRPSAPPSTRRHSGRAPAVLDVQINDDVDVEANVDLHSEHHFYNGFSENIGDGGIFVQSWAPKKVGDHLTLRITLPDEEAPIETIGEVRWVRGYDRASETAPGFGISFLDLDPRDKKRIERFLDQRKPLFYDE